MLSLGGEQFSSVLFGYVRPNGIYALCTFCGIEFDALKVFLGRAAFSVIGCRSSRDCAYHGENERGCFFYARLTIIQLGRFRLCLQKDFDEIGRPYSNAGSKEVRIFGPYRIGQCQCCCENRPIILIPAA